MLSWQRRILFLVSLISQTHQVQMKISSMPNSGDFPEPCALVCVGVGFYTTWEDSSWAPGKSLIRISMENCGFVSQPVITTTVAGPGKCPSLFVDKYGQNNFVGYTVGSMSAAYAIDQKCEVHWSAFGYNCQA